MARVPLRRLADGAAIVNIVHFRTVEFTYHRVEFDQRFAQPSKDYQMASLLAAIVINSLTSFSHSGRLQASVWREPSKPLLASVTSH